MSRHVILVAAIFGFYILAMGGLVGYIAWSGRHRESSGGQDDRHGDDEGDGSDPQMPLAA